MASVGEHCPQGPPRGAGRSEAEQRAALSFEATDTTNPAEGCRGETQLYAQQGSEMRQRQSASPNSDFLLPASSRGHTLGHRNFADQSFLAGLHQPGRWEVKYPQRDEDMRVLIMARTVRERLEQCVTECGQ